MVLYGSKIFLLGVPSDVQIVQTKRNENCHPDILTTRGLQSEWQGWYCLETNEVEELGIGHLTWNKN
jgi:hypothetical protein